MVYIISLGLIYLIMGSFKFWLPSRILPILSSPSFWQSAICSLKELKFAVQVTFLRTLWWVTFSLHKWLHDLVSISSFSCYHFPSHALWSNHWTCLKFSGQTICSAPWLHCYWFCPKDSSTVLYLDKEAHLLGSILALTKQKFPFFCVPPWHEIHKMCHRWLFICLDAPLGQELCLMLSVYPQQGCLTQEKC